MRRRGLPFQARIVLLTLAGGLPALLTAFLLLRDAPIPDSVHRLIIVLLIGAWVGFAIAVHGATVESQCSGELKVGELRLSVEFHERGLLGDRIEVGPLAAQLLLDQRGQFKGNSHS